VVTASSASATKKQKLEHGAVTTTTTATVPTSYSVATMRILHPLLTMLEHSLRADAHQGGKWTRADNHQKFDNVLEPLGQLLFSRIPPAFPVPEEYAHTDHNKYRYIVEGAPEDVGGSGSVIGCLSALAMAGGNEQLWKPLNHVVLQACGDDHRSDVRRAGLVCLLELMKSLGEEYMVLLPENLPIISELLEDSNDDVARLARYVVTQAEELLGESLEDSLR
jgi:hypothetical protein